MTDIHIINGPNLGRLGMREPAIYGSTTYADLESMIITEAHRLGVTVKIDQSDCEAELLHWIHHAADTHTPIILNAGGLTHTSVILRDACSQLLAPWIEVHISNIYSREEFRHHSYLSPLATGVIAGLGPQGYLLALHYLAHHPSVEHRR